MSLDFPYPLFPDIVGKFFQSLSLLPVHLGTKSEKYGQVNKFLLGYGALIVLAYDIFIMMQLYQGIPLLTRLPEKERIYFSITPVAIITVTNVVIIASNIQCKRGKFHQTIRNMISFDEEYAVKQLRVSTSPSTYIYMMLITYSSILQFCYVLLPVFDPEAEGILFYKIIGSIQSTLVLSTVELFLTQMHHVKSRYCLLNDTLKQFEYCKKPFEVKFLRPISGYIHCYDVSVIKNTRDLHDLLGETTKTINSLYKVQLLACVSVVLQAAATFPPCLHWFWIKQNVDTVFALVSSISYLLTTGIQLSLVISYTNALTMEAKKTTKLVILLLNSEISRYWHKELKSLLLQLPHQVHEVTLFDLIDFKPDHVISLISLMAVYSLLYAT